MVRTLLALMLLAAQPSPTGLDALVERTRTLIDQIMASNTEPFVSLFSDRMKTALPESQVRLAVAGVVTQAGAYRRQLTSRTDSRGDVHAVIVTCEFDRAMVDVSLAYDADGRIVGFTMRPAGGAAALPYVAPSYSKPDVFRESEVTVDAGGWPLPATLSMPNGPGPHPAVVLVHGSGPSDRDGSFGPNKVQRDLALGLASRGVAVLRYDKRTAVHAQRVARVANLTAKEEVIDDVMAAVRVLRQTEGVRPDRIFVLGHSFGGMLAPRIGTMDPAIAGFIVLAGAVRPLEDSIVSQSRYLAMLDGVISDAERTQLDAMEALAARVRALKPADPPVSAPGIAAPSSYFLDLRGYHPPTVARTLKQGFLVLQGERDYQVTMDDFGEWQKSLQGRSSARLRSYPKLNHLFMAGEGKSQPSEYMTPGHVAEEVIGDIATWIGTFGPQK